jgi:hypothetical protein
MDVGSRIDAWGRRTGSYALARTEAGMLAKVERKAFYVKRVSRDDGHVGWTRVRGEQAAERERAAWEASGRWSVEVLPGSRFVRRQVREWASHEAELAEARATAGTPARAARARLEG